MLNLFKKKSAPSAAVTEPARRGEKWKKIIDVVSDKKVPVLPFFRKLRNVGTAACLLFFLCAMTFYSLLHSYEGNNSADFREIVTRTASLNEKLNLIREEYSKFSFHTFQNIVQKNSAEQEETPEWINATKELFCVNYVDYLYEQAKADAKNAEKMMLAQNKQKVNYNVKSVVRGGNEYLISVAGVEGSSCEVVWRFTKNGGKYVCDSLPEPYQLLELDTKGERVILENRLIKGDILELPFDTSSVKAEVQNKDIVETDLSKVKLTGSYLIVDDGVQKKVLITNPGTQRETASVQKDKEQKDAIQQYIPFYFNQGDGVQAVLLPVPAPNMPSEKQTQPAPAPTPTP